LSKEDFRSYPPQADYLICGSDQIWNFESYRGYDSTFFLDFAGKNGQRRISYAATFGFAGEFGSHKQEIYEMLSNFDHLSVRDRKSENMVRELTGRSAKHVLDPTFLIDYSPITPPRIYKYPYTFVHCVSVTCGDFFVKAIDALSKKLNMQIICTDHPLPLRKAKFVSSAGPLQWLSLISNAEFVCTSSFHGTCFSLINKKQFMTFPITKGQARLDDILQTAGLSDRIINSEVDFERALANPINYSRVWQQLDNEVRSSRDYLREALK